MTFRDLSYVVLLENCFRTSPVTEAMNARSSEVHDVDPSSNWKICAGVNVRNGLKSISSSLAITLARSATAFEDVSTRLGFLYSLCLASLRNPGRSSALVNQSRSVSALLSKAASNTLLKANVLSSCTGTGLEETAAYEYLISKLIHISTRTLVNVRTLDVRQPSWSAILAFQSPCGHVSLRAVKSIPSSEVNLLSKEKAFVSENFFLYPVRCSPGLELVLLGRIIFPR